MSAPPPWVGELPASLAVEATGEEPNPGCRLCADFDVQVREFGVGNVAELLQSDLPVTGRLNLDAHVEGTATEYRTPPPRLGQ